MWMAYLKLQNAKRTNRNRNRICPAHEGRQRKGKLYMDLEIGRNFQIRQLKKKVEETAFVKP